MPRKKKLTTPTPDPRNARRHSDRNKSAVRASLRDSGAGRSVLLDNDDVIIAGNCAVEQATDLGIPIRVIDSDGSELIAVRRTDLGTDDRRRAALAIADNRTTDLSEFDDAVVADILRDFAPDELASAGFDPVEYAALLETVDPDPKVGLIDDDDVPESTETPTVVRGDLWLLGGHRLLCGDATDRDDIDRLMDGRKADIVFTDPPYGMNLDADFSGMKSRLPRNGERSYHKGGNKYDNVIGDDSPFDPTFFFDYFQYCDEQFWFGCDYYSDHLPPGGAWVVWDKRLTESADKMYGSCFELCWSKKKHKRDIARIKWAGMFGMDSEFDQKRLHPTQKPVRLVLWFFDRYKGTNVVDPFLGSGATLVGCEKTDRKCFGMEIDPHYCDVIIKRWEEFTGNTATKEGK